jgi:hypothetical protein
VDLRAGLGQRSIFVHGIAEVTVFSSIGLMADMVSVADLDHSDELVGSHSRTAHEVKVAAENINVPFEG